MIYMGIDPGIKGGIAVLYGNDPPVTTVFAETEGRVNAVLLRAFLAFHAMANDLAIAIEKVHSMPKQGVASSFKFGVNYGITLGTATTLGPRVRVELVTPQAWKKLILAGMNRDDQKQAAIDYCRRAWPGVSLVQPGCRKPHDGIADALCLAEYARRVYGQRV